jgi:hypothetical protein
LLQLAWVHRHRREPLFQIEPQGRALRNRELNKASDLVNSLCDVQLSNNELAFTGIGQQLARKVSGLFATGDNGPEHVGSAGCGVCQ